MDKAPVGWNTLDVTPPNKLLEVIDDKGRKAWAYPTYYPFKIEHRPGDGNKPHGWQGTSVPCELHWDGGWLISVSVDKSDIVTKVKFWREVDECPTCGAASTMSWSGLELVENSGDETLASKHYKQIQQVNIDIKNILAYGFKMFLKKRQL